MMRFREGWRFTDRDRDRVVAGAGSSTSCISSSSSSYVSPFKAGPKEAVVNVLFFILRARGEKLDALPSTISSISFIWASSLLTCSDLTPLVARVLAGISSCTSTPCASKRSLGTLSLTTKLQCIFLLRGLLFRALSYICK
jgi:hypothetical protein